MAVDKVQQLLTDHLDLWTSTIEQKSSVGRGSKGKKHLYGIKKLRELILELAVRGKLVPQDTNDEPASELLKRVAAERDRLVKDKLIKKPKVLPEISEEEKPFQLPDGWNIARLGSLSHVITKGTTPTSVGYPFTEHGINFVKVENIARSEINLSSISQYIDGATHKALSRSSLEVGDVLFSIAGTIGKTCIVSEKDIPANTNQALAIIKGTSAVFSPRFLLIQLDSFVSDKTREKARGGAMPNVSLGDLTNLAALIPPLPEQHRIVTKVDELMALCDQLEQQTEQQLDAHQQLVDTLLGTLTQSQNANALADNWARLSQHFDTLFTTVASIDQLKQTILQLAVMGKLVPQKPDDEPASALLQHIAAEKAQLIKEKKIKKQKPLPPISDEEKPFELPEGWELCRMDDICYGITSGSTPPKNEFSEESGIPYLKVYNIRDQAIDFEYKKQFVTPEYHTTKLGRSNLYPGDVVMNIVGPPLGKIAIIPNNYPEWNCNQAIVFFRPLKKQINYYLYTYLCSGIFLKKIELIGTAGQDNISVTKSRSIVLPFPPVTEQHRIVTKVNELFTLCDQLKARLQQNQHTQLLLTDTLIQETLSP